MTTFENGTKTHCGTVAVVDLHGSWHEMGRQYGALLRGELGHIHRFVRRIVDASDENRRIAADITALTARQHPWFLKRFFAGMAETSGLTAEELLYVDGVERIAGLPACSAIAACGAYTPDGKMVFGRNYDYGEIFRELSGDLAVTVFHPADGSLAAAIVGYVGEIYCVNGLNEKGIFLELNNGSRSSPDVDESRVYATTMLLTAMLQADSMDAMDRFFRTVRSDYAYIITAADAERAVAYEWDVHDVHIGETSSDEGLLIATNHYLHPAWPYPVPEDKDCWDSHTRRRNLTALCEAGKGRIDAAYMTDILGVHLKNGGATDELTVYQLVVEPGKLSMLLKPVGAEKWESLDLRPLLRG